MRQNIALGTFESRNHYPRAIFKLFDQSVYCWFEPDELEKNLSNPSLGLFPRDTLSQVMNQNGFPVEIPTRVIQSFNLAWKLDIPNNETIELIGVW